MKPDMSKNPAINDIPSPSFLTPTTLKNITQILESEECMKGIRTFEETGNADKAIAAIEAKEKPKTTKTTSSYNIKTRSGNTYFSLDSKSWQGGITTIATPTDRGVTLAEKIQEENIDNEEGNSDEENNSEIVNGYILPESVVQTNIRQQKNKPTVQRTMITRSLSNMSNSSSKNSSKPYYPGEDKSFIMGRKTSAKGRKNNRRMSPEEEAMSAEERERLRLRRQRNKEAAARCRKRRVDQTNDLQGQVDHWLAKKRMMEEEIGALRREEEELKFILSQHCQADGLCALGGKQKRNMIVPGQTIVVRRSIPAVKPNFIQHRQVLPQMSVFNQPRQITVTQNRNPVVAIKSEPSVIVEPANPIEQTYILPEQIQIPVVKQEPNLSVVVTTAVTNNTPQQPLRRPASLGLKAVTVVQQPQETQHSNKLSEHGISIDTPSSIVPSLNFDTFTSTGLTPTATPVSGFSFPVTSSISTPGSLNTPMTNTASTIGSRCSTQQKQSEGGIGSVADINSPEGISLVSL